MSLWSDVRNILGDAAPVIGGLLGGPAGAAVGSVVARALGVGNSPDAVTRALQTDPKALAKVIELERSDAMKLALAKLADQSAQVKVDEEEAKSSSLFVSGWRPAIGWICGIAFGVAYVLEPLVAWGAALDHAHVVLPALDLSTMMPVLLGMLGLGGLRTAEKIKGSSRVQD